MRENNLLLRQALKDLNLRQWEAAEKLGIDETVFSRKLRHELSEDEQRAIVDALK